MTSLSILLLTIVKEIHVATLAIRLLTAIRHALNSQSITRSPDNIKSDSFMTLLN